jgi:hypothetical protein
MILSDRGSDNEGVPNKYPELKFLGSFTEVSYSGTVSCSCPLAKSVNEKNRIRIAAVLIFFSISLW